LARQFFGDAGHAEQIHNLVCQRSGFLVAMPVTRSTPSAAGPQASHGFAYVLEPEYGAGATANYRAFQRLVQRGVFVL
jgi:hypothetical protein